MTRSRFYAANTIYNPLNGPQGLVDQGFLWVTDDDGYIYHIFPNGEQWATFQMPGGITSSGITVASDGTLYVVSESTNKLYHFKRDGTLIGTPVPSTTWGASFNPETEGVAYDDRDDTLWIMDDGMTRVYHIETDGTLIEEFSVPVEIPSPQGISLDPRDYTFWVSDNNEEKIFHLDADITIITADTIDVSSLSTNLQGCAFEPVQCTLWLLVYSDAVGNPGYMYRIDPRAKTVVTGYGYPLATSLYGSTARGTGLTFDYN